MAELLPIFLLRFVKVDDATPPAALAEDNTGDFMLKVRANLEPKACCDHPFAFGFCLYGSDFARHWRHVKNSLESRGALNLKAANVWDIEAMMEEMKRFRTGEGQRVVR